MQVAAVEPEHNLAGRCLKHSAAPDLRPFAASGASATKRRDREHLNPEFPGFMINQRYSSYGREFFSQARHSYRGSQRATGFG